MASDEVYEEFGGGGEDIYDDVAPTPYNGHPQSYTPPTMPQPRPEPKSRTLPPGRSAPVIPSRAPTTSLSHQTLQNKPPAQQDKKKGKPKKATKQAPPPPVNTSGGLDMNEILRKRQKINTNRFEDLEKSKKDDEEDKLAPWQLEKKRGGPNRSSIVRNESNTKASDDDEPEFIKKRRSMSLRDSEDETPISPPPVASKPSAPIVPIKEERSPPLKHQPPVVNPKPKPTPRPKPGITNSPPLAPKPKPAPPSRKDSLPNSSDNPPSPSTRPAFEKSVKPPVPIPPKPGLSPHIERRSNNPPLPEEELPPPPFKPPPPSDSPPTIKARPPIANRSPSRVNPSSGESPPLAQHQTKSSPVLPPKPSEGLPPKPPQVLPPKPSENATPTFKPPAPLPPVQSVAEPTPIAPSVLKYRRLPLPPVDINNPPPLPSRALKPSTGFTSKRAPLIPTESQDIDEDIYDDTLAVTGDHGGDNGGEDIYDDTVPATSEIEPLNEDDEEIYDDVAAGGPPPSLPSRPPKLPPIPSTPPPVSSAPPIRSPPPTLPVPPIPVEEEQEDYEEPGKLQNPGASSNIHDHGTLPPVPPSPHSRSTLPLPPIQQTAPSPIASPTMQRRSLTKEEKKQLKEDERRAREQRRLDQLKEKEMKKREEQKTKNRQKSMKAFKDYKLPDYIQPLFSVEILSNKKASKFHMSVVAGERMSVLLIAHDNLPRGLYLVEKEDGTVGLVDEIITERTVYQSAQQLGIQQSTNNFGYGDDEDIYEALEPDVDDGKVPALPPMNSHTIPQEDEDPQDVYECLPEN